MNADPVGRSPTVAEGVTAATVIVCGNEHWCAFLYRTREACQASARQLAEEKQAEQLKLDPYR